MGVLLAVEGICCSGKSTFCNNLISKLNSFGLDAYYNHGAFTYTDIGKEFKLLSQNMDCPIGTSFYICDLIINTQNIIKPLINNNHVIIQDRYYDSIATYIAAYGKHISKNYNIDSLINRLKENDILMIPTITIYCIPPFEVVIKRLQNSKNSLIHNFYRQNLDFFRLVYEENVIRSNINNNSLVVDTSSSKSIEKSINEILKAIKEVHYE